MDTAAINELLKNALDQAKAEAEQKLEERLTAIRVMMTAPPGPLLTSTSKDRDGLGGLGLIMMTPSRSGFAGRRRPGYVNLNTWPRFHVTVLR